MSRKGRIRFGLAVLGGGVAVTIVSYVAAASLGGGTYVIAFGAMIYGAVQVIRGLDMPRDDQPDPERLEQSPGRAGPALGDQVVGQPCSHCYDKILTRTHGWPCPMCRRPVHESCQEAHAAASHGISGTKA